MRTATKKYFKKLSFGDLERVGYILPDGEEAQLVDWKQDDSTLAIDVRKPTELLQAEERAAESRAKLLVQARKMNM